MRRFLFSLGGIITAGTIAFQLAACSQPDSSNIEGTVTARVEATLGAALAAAPVPPTAIPAVQPTAIPTALPTAIPTVRPTAVPAPSVTPQRTDQQKMGEMLSVRLTGLRLVLKDIYASRFSDEIHFEFEFENKGQADIRAFTGVSTFADVFDRPIKRVNITHDQKIAVGQTKAWKTLYIELNQFMREDQTLAATKFENIRFSFEPRSIILADGTQLGSVRP